MFGQFKSRGASEGSGISVGAALSVLVVAVVLGLVLWLVRSDRAEEEQVKASYAQALTAYQETVREWDDLVARAADLAPDCAVDVGRFPAVCSSLSWIADANKGLTRVAGLETKSLGVDQVREGEKALRMAQGEVDGLVGRYAVEVKRVETQIVVASKAFRVESLEPELDRGRKVITAAEGALADAPGDSRAVAEKVKGRMEVLQKLIDDVEGRKKDIRITEGRDVITALAHGRARVEDAGKLLASWSAVRPDLKNLQLDTDQNAVREIGAGMR